MKNKPNKKPEIKMVIQPFTPPAGVKRVTLKKTKTQIGRGLHELDAWVDSESYHLTELSDDLWWKLEYCWGWPNNPKFRAEAKVNGKRTTLHRMIAFGGDMKAGEGLFVIPFDEDPLHCWKSNLRIMTKDERDAYRKTKAVARGELNEVQQEWLETEMANTKKSRWQVIGKLIDAEIARRNPPGIEPDPFA